MNVAIIEKIEYKDLNFDFKSYVCKNRKVAEKLVNSLIEEIKSKIPNLNNYDEHIFNGNNFYMYSKNYDHNIDIILHEEEIIE